VVANDPVVKGGTYTPLATKKHLRAQKVALENCLPCVYLVESGGGQLWREGARDEDAGVYADENGFGRVFYNQARLSAMGAAQIAVVLGSCTAGGAYVPAMADEVVIVRKNGTIFLGGPPLVEAATGEKVSAEELGGGEVHTQISGVADHLAEDEPHALRLTRQIVDQLPPPPPPSIGRVEPVPPLLPEEEMHGMIPADPRKTQMDMRGILARLLDASELDEFKAEYGTSLVTGFGRIEGYPVGIVANDGILESDSSVKGAHFVQLCCQRNIPLLFLQNITGFMVGKDAEHGGIAKHGAKLVNAVATAAVPKFTVVVGGSYGAGNYGMCGRAYSPRFMWMWPNAKIAVMGGDQAAGVLTTVRVEGAKKAGKPLEEAETESYHQKMREQYEHESKSYFASARLWDDGIIEPTQTRTVLSLALAAAANAPVPKTTAGVFRM
jgi:3-methylcrotonyl-CoA carboxylase beta subunit